MVANIYTYILQYEDIGGNLVEKLQQMNVFPIFVKMAKCYEEDLSKFNKVLFYILHTYSLQSKFHVLGADWQLTKNNVAKHVGIKEDEDLYNDAVLLENTAVVITIQNYLDYQGEKNFKHLCMLKDLYEQMVSSAVANIKKASDEIDYDQKYKNHEYAGKLLEEIKQWEQRVADSNKELKEAINELRTHNQGNHQRSLRLEDNIVDA